MPAPLMGTPGRRDEVALFNPYGGGVIVPLKTLTELGLYRVRSFPQGAMLQDPCS